MFFSVFMASIADCTINAKMVSHMIGGIKYRDSKTGAN